MVTKTNEVLIVRAAELGDSIRVRNLLEGGISPNASAPRKEGEIFGGVITARWGIPVFIREGFWDAFNPTITALQAAAAGGHQETTEILIEAGASVNTPGADAIGRTALQGAAENGHGEIVQLLLGAKADVNALSSQRHGISALQGAAGNGHDGIIKLLLSAGADANAPASKYGGRTALQAAAGNGNDETVRLLLRAKADVNAPASEYGGRTALQAAAGGGHHEIVELLLGANAVVNAPASEEFGRTALQAAAESGWDRIVKLLLKAKADVNAPASESRGRTALQAAAGNGNDETVRLLLGAKADANAPASEEFGKTALHAAAENGRDKIVKLLLKAKADVNVPASEHDGRTALQAAAERGHEGVVQLLLENGADVNAPASVHGGRTALQAAAENGHEEVVELLLKAKADVNAPASVASGRTSLQAAAENGHDKIVRLLLNAKANVNALASQRHGISALQGAAGNGHTGIVQLLLGARVEPVDVNAPASEYGGRTALQAAAENGHGEVVKLLLAANADFNAPASVHDGRTALQAAAEKGHGEVVKLLLKANADVNAPPSPFGGRIALCGAAGNGHHGIVKELLSAKADVNAPASEGFRRTAIQAAAENGHGEIVQLLLENGADVNAPASVHDGRTALQAAAEKGHGEVVKLLLKAKADVNAPPSSFGGRIALFGAARNGYEEIVKLLLEAKANVNATSPGRNREGALAAAVVHGHEAVAKHLLDFKADANLTFGGMPTIHIAASNKAINIVKLLIGGGANPNVPDYLGETVLHKAVATADVNWLRSLLDLRVFDIDAPDPRGQTPLQLALEVRPDHFNDICALLLARGASTHGLSVDILPRTGGNNEVVFLEQNQEGGKSMRWGLPGCSLMQSGEGPSVCLLHLESRTRNGAPKFFHPGTYISDSRARGIVFPEAEAVVEFRWMNRRREYIPGVPILRDGGFEGWLIGYVCFNSFVYGGDADAVMPSFEVTDRKIGISWIMTNYYSRSGESTMLRKPLRSVHYRGSLTHLSIPAHCVEFFTWLLRDVRQKWEELFSQSESYLDNRNRALLSARGGNPTLIHSLLEDGHQWSMFRTRLRLHVSKSRELQKDFESNAAFYHEVLDFERKSQVNQAAPAGRPALLETPQGRLIPGLQHKPLAIVGLVGLIEEMEKTLNDRISDLESRTNQMIEMEFNLISIFEARRSIEMSMRSIEMSARSIEMSARSIEMSASLKRLGWITVRRAPYTSDGDANWDTKFIFLPLMFANGLFGMNVDLLKDNPSWTWYLAFAIPSLAFVFSVWAVFKYTGIEKWIESNIGRYLESKIMNRRDPAPRSSTLGADMGSGHSAGTDLGVPSAFEAKLGHQVGASVSKGWLKRRIPQLDQTHSV